MSGPQKVTAPRVLLVEDDPAITSVLRLSFRAAGFQLTEVSTGGEALQMLERERPDAVVLDPGLPDRLGGAVLEWLRRDSGGSGKGLAWVVISARNVEDVVAHYGPVHSRFLAKPFNPWDLVGMLQGLLSAGGMHG